MQYEGPIYRPPSEADSILVQATLGCPHNQCTFCMVYKNGPRFRARSVDAIKKDLEEAKNLFSGQGKNLFLPAGNTIAMKTEDLCSVCSLAREFLPDLGRITVYGSSQYLYKKGREGLKKLKSAGLTRVHVGLESGDNIILKKVKKGTDPARQIEACTMAMEAGIEISVYVVLGLGGLERTKEHARETARVLNAIKPDFIRLRTFVPKINTPLLQDVRDGLFTMLTPHQVLLETRAILSRLKADSYLASDHYTNYINLEGRMPGEKQRLLGEIDQALQMDETGFRPFFIGRQ